jgi:ectoine hydroxylase-related dioxygenase (phytanoyl-CoA dioxygenase family)
MPDPHDFHLDQEHVNSYEENGYLVVDSIATPEEIEKLRGIYDRLFEEKAGRDSGDQFDLAGTDDDDKQASLPQILGPSKYAPELLEGTYRKNAEKLAKQLLGEDAEINGEHMIFKPAGSGAPTPWHQDEAYWPPENEYRSLSIWIPLQDATKENGCMAFVPGSHKEEVREHRPIGGDPRVHGLETLDVSDDEAVFCPIKPGMCTVHGSRTLHYAGPNVSDIPRRAYILTAGAPFKPRNDGRRFPWLEGRETARDKRAKSAGNKNQ